MAGEFPRIRDIHDIEAIENEMPFEDRLEYTNAYDLARAGATREPSKVAVYFHPHGEPDETPEIITYAELWAGINQAANLFHDLGVGPSDRVSYLLPAVPQVSSVLWGAVAAGIASPINWMLEPDHIASIIRSVQPKVLLALAPAEGIDIWRKVEAIRDRIPGVEHILQVRSVGTPDGSAPVFEDELGAYRADRLSFDRRVGLDDTAACMHTGGTTGAPKITRNAHRGLLFQDWAAVVGMGLSSDDVVWAAGPTFHVAILTGGGLGTIARGMTTVNPGPLGFRHRKILPNYWRIMERYKITRVYGVPTIMLSLVDVPVPKNFDKSRLRFSMSSSSPLPADVNRKLEEITGLKIGLTWGLTETTASLTNQPKDGEVRYGSSGLRKPYNRIRAVMLDSDGRYVRDCGTDEIGVFFVKGPGLIPGYLDSRFDKGAFTEDGWFNTGDMGRIDADEYIWVTGRAKDLIIRGGHNIDPRLIEEPLHKHPEVKLVGAVGKPDGYAGELPVAYVELKPGAKATAEELKAFAREHVLERAAVPVDVFVIDKMPLTGVEKIQKPELRLDAAKRTFTALLEPLLAGDVTLAVEVGRHDVHGTMARVRLSGGAAETRVAVEEKVRKAMAPFSMAHEVTWV